MNYGVLVEKKPSFQKPHISLNWLKTFDVAARVNSFKLAADELCITPSAVSQQIKELERALGIPLFNRKSQGLYLNEAGQIYWQEIRTALSIIQSATDKIRPNKYQYKLKISLIPPIANHFIFPNLASFNKQHPDIKLIFEVNEKLVDLNTSDVDVAIRYSSSLGKEGDYEKLTPVLVQPVCNHILAQTLDLSANPHNIVNAPLIHMSNTPSMWTDFLKVMGLEKALSVNDIYVNDYQAAMSAVLSQGVAITLYSLEKSYIKQHNLVNFPSLQLEFGAIYAVTAKGRLQETAIEHFITWLKSLLKSSD